jgi:hypothetical protein
MALGMEQPAVPRGDAAAFLAAMLQGIEAERRQSGRVLAAKDADHAAFFMKPVIVEPFIVKKGA